MTPNTTHTSGAADLPAIISGALFDFAGFLTTLDKSRAVTFSGAHEAGPAVTLLQEWSTKRGLNLDEADVSGWRSALTVQALSAAPAGWKLVPVEPTDEMLKAADDGDDEYTLRSFGPGVQRVMQGPYDHYCAMLAASPTPPAEQQVAQVIIDFSQVGTAGPFPVANGRVSLPDATMQDLARMLRPTYEAEQQAAPKAAPGVGNSGFDYKTAADFLSGKTVSDEALRKFVAASRGAHDARAALHAKMLSLQGELASREAEIALLKKALLEAEAAPQQEAQEPVAWLSPWRADQVTTDYDAYGERGIPLYEAPQPAPDCHHRPPCDECAALAAQGGSDA